jgi:hypothetical protein
MNFGRQDGFSLLLGRQQLPPNHDPAVVITMDARYDADNVSAA